MRTKKLLGAAAIASAIGVINPQGAAPAYADEDCSGYIFWCATVLGCTTWDSSGKCTDISKVDYYCTKCGAT